MGKGSVDVSTITIETPQRQKLVSWGQKLEYFTIGYNLIEAVVGLIAGFLSGILLIPLFRRRQLVDAKRSGVVLDIRDLDGRGWW